MNRVFENKTGHLIVFSVRKDERGERRAKWYTVPPGESIDVELDSSELQGPNSWERAELFGLTQKSDSVTDVVKVSVPIIPHKKTRRKKK